VYTQSKKANVARIMILWLLAPDKSMPLKFVVELEHQKFLIVKDKCLV
jgi:hypothetical protein